MVTLWVVREGVHYTLLHETDQVLLDDLAEIGLILREADSNDFLLHQELDRKAKGHVHHQWFIQLFDLNRMRSGRVRTAMIFFGRPINGFGFTRSVTGVFASRDKHIR